MNKKILGIIIALVLVVLIIVGLLVFIPKKKKVSSTFDLEGYKVTISANPIENDNRDTYFTTSFEVVSNNTGKKEVSMYFVDFDGIYKDKLPKDVKDIKINNKTFKYIQTQSNYDADLYYQIPNTNEYILIGISGGSVYSDGVQLKLLAPVDDKLLNSKELADTLDFDINK